MQPQLLYAWQLPQKLRQMEESVGTLRILEILISPHIILEANVELMDIANLEEVVLGQIRRHRANAGC